MPLLPLSSFPLGAWLGADSVRNEEVRMSQEEAAVPVGNNTPHGPQHLLASSSISGDRRLHFY